MRKKAHSGVCILLLVTCTATLAAVPSISEILKTDQYILVSHYGGAVSAETNVPSEKCPFLMLKPTLKRDSREYIGLHLVRDPKERFPPRYLTVIPVKNQEIDIKVYDINMTGVFEPPRKTVSSDTRTQKTLKNNRLINSLFDSTSRHVFADFSTADRIHFKQYYINGLFTSNIQLRFIRDIERTSPSSRFDWAEDHYSGKFYYKEKVDNEIGLFEIPMTSFVPTVLEGEPGTRVGTLNELGSLHGANGGGLFSVLRREENGESKMYSSLVPSGLGVGLQCKIIRKPSEVPEKFGFIVIRENDFCMLRDGPEYNKENCEAEQREFMASHGESDASSEAVKWLLVVCLVMFMIIVLLFVYIYWLRSTFISDDERDHANERFQYETEASLFVSKQRSFPSVYQDPALLDVSVDKWN